MTIDRLCELERRVLALLERNPMTRAEVTAALPESKSKRLGAILSTLKTRGILFAEKIPPGGFGRGQPICRYHIVAAYAHKAAA